MDEMDFFPIFLTSLAMTETFPVLSNRSSQSLVRYVKLSQFCFEGDINNRSMQHGLNGSWKTWNFIVAFSRTGKSWTKATGSGNVLNSRQKYDVMADSKEIKH